jgi:CubicO group peptidase (beta-lactamase class C family)/D-alanyl-D-alanine dipeptidase
MRTRFFLALAAAVLVAPRLHAQAAITAAKPYAEITKTLESIIEREVKDKELPALSVALVDDQKVVWARGFGLADPKAKKPATAETVYRVGSVSKLFTDIALMRLVEKGELDLDAPVTKYLPDFKPKTKFDKPITLRMLLSHRAGVVRESPVGNYFDPTSPSLEAMVRSMNDTENVYEPGARIKYSNAGIATAGYVLEKIHKQPFATFLGKSLLTPMGMTQSSFEPTDAVKKNLAKAEMWTYPGRTFEAPTWELGMPPAGSMYSTAPDLGRFLTILFNRGQAEGERILKPETLEKMYEPQFAKPGEKTGFGIGFYLTELDGKRVIGHGGAVYGFATELAALPGEKLGVVVIASKDGANAVTHRIGESALRLMLAAKEGKPLPQLDETKPLDAEEARKLAGRYKGGEKGEKWFDLFERGGRLFALPGRGGMRAEVKKIGDDLILDDTLDYGTRLKRKDGKLVLGATTYERVEVPRPAPPPERWLGLIGEYGWDHQVMLVLERDGKLQVLIEWFFLYPLTEESENVFQFPDFGLYHGEKLIFTRDKNGRATKVNAANVVMERRNLAGENGETFRIKPERPVDELRKLALAATPPREKGELAKPDLVELVSLDDSIKLDIRYATTNNFLSTPFYPSAKAFMQRPAAEAVARAHKKLEKQGFGLLIHDGYRPWQVTKMFWDATPEKLRLFVADPEQGSRHNRGCAVDLTLYDRKTGKPLVMPGGYDEMSDRSWPDYLGGTSEQRWLRDRLRHAMEEDGFTVYEAEWWHFDYKDWRSYPIINLTFDKLPSPKPKPKP